MVAVVVMGAFSGTQALRPRSFASTNALRLCPLCCPTPFITATVASIYLRRCEQLVDQGILHNWGSSYPDLHGAVWLPPQAVCALQEEVNAGTGQDDGGCRSDI